MVTVTVTMSDFDANRYKDEGSGYKKYSIPLMDTRQPNNVLCTMFSHESVLEAGVHFLHTGYCEVTLHTRPTVIYTIVLYQ